MAIIATNETVLAWFTDLLHDCFLLIPYDGFRVEDKVVKLVFQDREREKFKDRSTLLDLRV